jgi:1-acyl-sn-glycerol-3-phosphate acyltransferase
MIKVYPLRNRLARWIAYLRGLVFFGLLAVSILFFGFWLIPAAIYFKRAAFIRWMNRTYLGIAHPLFGIRFDVQGKENLSARHSVMVCNHQSWLDITTIMLEVRYPAFLAKKEIERWPFFGGAMRVVDCVFVDRNDRRSRQNVALEIRQKLARGVDFCIFPEGTRSLDGSLGEFAGGAFRIATDAEALITPVVIDESWWILNKKGFFLYPGTIRVRVLPPIDTALPGNQDYKELTKRIHGLMAAALADMRREPKASGFAH